MSENENEDFIERDGVKLTFGEYRAALGLYEDVMRAVVSAAVVVDALENEKADEEAQLVAIGALTEYVQEAGHFGQALGSVTRARPDWVARVREIIASGEL